ncbi:hypothetical protein QJQ45_029973 [Haematococcus lacustris]|nr:hypothetical protein QJQ45_029973 [Haematococcus lacustris]
MSVEEAVELGKRSIYHATFRDCASGGTVSVYHVTEAGWKKVGGDDVTELHFKYYPEPAKHPANASCSLAQCNPKLGALVWRLSQCHPWTTHHFPQTPHVPFPPEPNSAKQQAASTTQQQAAK